MVDKERTERRRKRRALAMKELRNMSDIERLKFFKYHRMLENGILRMFDTLIRRSK